MHCFVQPFAQRLMGLPHAESGPDFFPQHQSQLSLSNVIQRDQNLFTETFQPITSFLFPCVPWNLGHNGPIHWEKRPVRRNGIPPNWELETYIIEVGRSSALYALFRRKVPWPACPDEISLRSSCLATSLLLPPFVLIIVALVLDVTFRHSAKGVPSIPMVRMKGSPMYPVMGSVLAYLRIFVS